MPKTIVMLFVLLVVACGKPIKQAGECRVDRDCPLGKVCQEKERFCITADCDFCTDDQICYKPSPDSEGSCSAPPDCDAGECGVSTPDMGTPEMGTPDLGEDSACARLDREVVNFGPVEVDMSATEVVTVENCSASAPLTVEGTSIGPFAAEQLVVAAGESGAYQVAFAPTSVGSFSSELLVSTDAGSFRVAATGEGVDPGSLCPVAAIEAGVAGMLSATANQVHEPGTVVTLSAESSEAQVGEVAAFTWSVVERPATSMTMLSAPTEATTTLELDVLGNYTVELEVTDSRGTAGCAPARVTLLAADEGVPRFRIVLTWDTPTDANQTDSNGTDVDLHYLNPMGEWNTEPGDIFWRNPTADWAGEDPELTIDDTDGAGPEEIVHNAPRTDENYRIGAYYYADNGLGPSYATLQFYVNGVLSFEHRDMFMPTTGTFWGGFELNGLSEVVSEDKVVVQQGFPQTP